jgi:D-alanyl-lipoteichoic acid acyltransferase DltB (MBOAT superfamily)
MHLEALGFHAHPYTLNLILPLGISFYTFQALSYTIDVYRRRLPATKDYIQYMCFITFFPHMVAGPIQQAHHFLVQFGQERRFDGENAADGCRQMLWGFFKKMVIADTLARYVQAAYQNPAAFTGGQLLWATYFFAFQIYCDFSGYTDIAIGCAKIFGFHMTRNFAYPYFSRSIPEFWHRWHITLSDWFRDYLYYPLGGNRLGKARQRINAMTVFILSGLWHGASWTFVMWGALHGVFYLAFSALGFPTVKHEKGTPGGEGLLPNLSAFLLMLVTFQLACIGWVFFRASSLSKALLILGKSADSLVSLHLGRPLSNACLAWIVLLVGFEWMQRRHAHPLMIARWPAVFRWGAYYALIAIILFRSPMNYTPFIYFQF